MKPCVFAQTSSVTFARSVRSARLSPTQWLIRIPLPSKTPDSPSKMLPLSSMLPVVQSMKSKISPSTSTASANSPWLLLWPLVVVLTRLGLTRLSLDMAHPLSLLLQLVVATCPMPSFATSYSTSNRMLCLLVNASWRCQVTTCVPYWLMTTSSPASIPPMTSWLMATSTTSNWSP